MPASNAIRGRRSRACSPIGGRPSSGVFETRALVLAIESGAGVIDCGGGIVQSEENRRLLRERCRVVWLEVEPAEAATRLAGVQDRPLLEGEDPERRLSDLLAARSPWYEEVAHVRVATGGRDMDAVAAEIAAWAGGHA